MKRPYVNIFVALILSLSVNAQDLSSSQQKAHPKNAFYGTLGTALVLTTAGVGYERSLIHRDDAIFNSLLIKARANYTEDDQDEIYFYSDISSVLLFGRKHNLLEFGLGMGIDYTHSKNQWIPFPSFGVGYRYQNPDGGLILRTGIGYPDLLHVSIGVSY